MVGGITDCFSNFVESASAVNWAYTKVLRLKRCAMETFVEGGFPSRYDADIF